jgi:hypothetical protein
MMGVERWLVTLIEGRMKGGIATEAVVESHNGRMGRDGDHQAC